MLIKMGSASCTIFILLVIRLHHTDSRSPEIGDATGPCSAVRDSVDSTKLGAYRPQCTESGWYESRQCHSSTGYCWCVTRDGKEINGTRKGPGQGTVTCHQGDATGPCSAVRDSVNSTKLGAYRPQCTKSGWYESRQCHSSTGYCWCVTRDGKEINGTRKGPGQGTVTCHQGDATGPCSAVRDSVDSTKLGAYRLQCTKSGWYESRQCHSSTGYCWCVTRDGKEINGTRKGPGQGTVTCHQDVVKFPEQVNITNVTYTSFLVSWSVPPYNGSDITRYDVCIVKSRDKSVAVPTVVSLLPNVTAYSLTSLKPGTRYLAYVVVFYSSGLNASSYHVSHMTAGFGGLDRPCDCDPSGSNVTLPCDYTSGQCVCHQYTKGRHCDKCTKLAHKTTTMGCRPCHCPDFRSDGTCSVTRTGLVQCGCVRHTQGVRCDGCESGYYLSLNGSCLQCHCNGNSDSCDDHTGNCLACQFNTTGAQCHQCLPGYVGDAPSHNCSRISHASAVVTDNRHAVVVIVVSVTAGALLLVIIFIIVYKNYHRPSKPFNFWTVELRDDHENVNFSSLMEQPDLQNIDATLLIDDARFSDTEDKRNIVKNSTYQPVRT